jgi:hypothetical protein
MIHLGGKYCTVFSQNLGYPWNWLIELRLQEIHNEVRVGKHLCDNFPIQNGPKQGDALSTLLLNFALVYAIRKV